MVRYRMLVVEDLTYDWPGWSTILPTTELCQISANDDIWITGNQLIETNEFAVRDDMWLPLPKRFLSRSLVDRSCDDGIRTTAPPFIKANDPCSWRAGLAAEKILRENIFFGDAQTLSRRAKCSPRIPAEERNGSGSLIYAV